LVRRAEYGPHMSVVVNMGEDDFEYQGTLLPQYGVRIESPTFLAFCAKKFNGLDYGERALFTIESLDGQPISHSSHLRLSHAFGPDQIRLPLWGRIAREQGCTVTTEETGTVTVSVPSEGELFLQ